MASLTELNRMLRELQPKLNAMGENLIKITHVVNQQSKLIAQLSLRIEKMEAFYNSVEVNHCSESQCPNRREFGSMYCRQHTLAKSRRILEREKQ